MTVPIARRTLFAERRRAVLAIAGVAVALTLVLVFQAILAGAMDKVTFYLRTSPADLFVSQSRTTTMHMSASMLPPATLWQVAAVDGVEWVAPLAYMTGALDSGDHQQLSYVFGYDTISGGGGPPALIAGRAPRRGETVVDTLAGAGVGDQVQVAGRTFTVSGVFEGATTITNTMAFVDIRDFASLGRNPLSYLLVGVRPSADPDQVAAAIDAAVPGVTVQTRDQFVDQEERVVADMTADVMRLMTIIAAILAVAVVALVLSAVTRANLRSYAVIEALGARPRVLARTLTLQAAWTALAATATATAITLALALIVPRLAPTLPLSVRPAAVLQATTGALLAAMAGALLPLRRITTVDPATAFRRAT